MQRLYSTAARAVDLFRLLSGSQQFYPLILGVQLPCFKPDALPSDTSTDPRTWRARGRALGCRQARRQAARRARNAPGQPATACVSRSRLRHRRNPQPCVGSAGRRAEAALPSGGRQGSQKQDGGLQHWPAHEV
jgi:hypothetical protein